MQLDVEGQLKQLDIEMKKRKPRLKRCIKEVSWTKESLASSKKK